MSTRSTLKGYFKKGSIPTETQFADFIDSTLNFDDDTILKSSGGPLSIKANGTEETLLNFYRADQDGNTLTWQIKQKPAGKAGLSISSADGTSRLFIDSATGKMGLGTANPQSPLSVAGGLAVGANYAGKIASSVNGLLVEGSVGIGIGATAPRTALDTGTGVMSGSANDYQKAQFALNGGGLVTWDGPGGYTCNTQK